jgi:DNA primase
MGKISPVSIKYSIVAKITLSSLADRPDVIGAIFGQTEGLLGSELELRELQKTGKIGRIEVNLKNRQGKSEGEIIVPSSMNKSETAIIAAAIETIDRVGPCNARIRVDRIEDIRVSKREFILTRAEELLKELVNTLPDSTEFTNKVTQTVRTLEIQEYGADKLPAGPMIDGSDEIIVVEGRADVVTLLKYGIRNVVALNGEKDGNTLINLIRQKSVTLFVDGDRGGDLIIKKLSGLADIDSVAKAPDGKEVEELTLKEIQKALRGKVESEQSAHEFDNKKSTDNDKPRSAPRRDTRRTNTTTSSRYSSRQERAPRRTSDTRTSDTFVSKHGKVLKDLSDDLIGTRGAYVLDDGLNILGKVPVKELDDTLNDMSEPAFALILDGNIDSKLAKTIDTRRIKYVISKDDKNERTRAQIVLKKDL